MARPRHIHDGFLFGVVNTPNEYQYSTVEILIAGEWDHPVYGKIVVDRKLMDTMRRNFDRFKMAGRTPVDYNHGTENPNASPEQAAAAGWIQKLVMVGEKSLQAVVKWNPSAVKMIKDGKYKLISPAFSTDYKHPQSKGTVGPWLKSVALTNTPFLKTTDGGMKPVALSELAEQVLNDKHKENSEMEFKEIEVDGKPYRVAVEDFDTFSEVLQGMQSKLSSIAEERDAVAAELKLVNLQVEEDRKLSETAETDQGEDPIVKLLHEQNTALAERISLMETKSAEASAERLLSDAVGAFKLTKAEAESPSWRKLATDNAEMFSDIVANKPPVVEAPAGSETGLPSKEDVFKNFNDMTKARVTILRETNPDTEYNELLVLAQTQIANENPELADAAFGVPTQG